MYVTEKKTLYDFSGESYSHSVPNLHPYPATMIPQIGIEILKELRISSGKLLDPYCGSGSSFTAALHAGIDEMTGFDLNPLAILICKAKFTQISPDDLIEDAVYLKEKLYENFEKKRDLSFKVIDFKNIDYWFSESAIHQLSFIRHHLTQIKNETIRNFFWVAFSELIRKVSYTRDNEFKLYRKKNYKESSLFEEDFIEDFFILLKQKIEIYKNHYFPLLGKSNIVLFEEDFQEKKNYYDTVLTSPPYGDSRTTVAYGQFSFFANIWKGNEEARKIDSFLMGGKKSSDLFLDSEISSQILEISEVSPNRAFEVSSFYFDLAESIRKVACSIKESGYSIYVVGNRTVKGITLNTDQFIAEQFEKNSFRHLFTYERLLSNKRMPEKNSPTNQAGNTGSTMSKEYIVVCKKI